ncbi:hypothetical protein EWM64_g3874 [Hericium alpestre]|uniref:Uncharacterized protein n=1 Tax=Hericium alpestre TaxID=135208 RepID=A0A4Z0A1H6_9AGAM|nr:hypothetical protein EWM64_g3874 [Hericium alpestre]
MPPTVSSFWMRKKSGRGYWYVDFFIARCIYPNWHCVADLAVQAEHAPLICRAHVLLHPAERVVQAAKVLFKTIGPSTVYTDLPSYVFPSFHIYDIFHVTSLPDSLLDKYPGFPQAEQLLYPMEICQRLAVLLKESNACYPESMRTMTGLDVGWLLRA